MAILRIGCYALWECGKTEFSHIPTTLIIPYFGGENPNKITRKKGKGRKPLPPISALFEYNFDNTSKRKKLRERQEAFVICRIVQ